MKITIKGFRCHVDAEYEFRDGVITLLSGPSGAGKSTVFQSIYWCLYGSLRGIYNNTGESTKCSVTLGFTNYTVYRQGRPGLLKFVYNDHTSTTYEDAVAQQLINQHFGKKEIWKACCYIEQGLRCTLLTGSNTERMDLLNNLSFSTDDPEACISRIDAELKSVQQEFHAIQIGFKTECDIFAQELATNPVDPAMIQLIPEIDRIKMELTSVRQELDALTKTQLDQKHLQGVYQTLIAARAEKTKELDQVRATENHCEAGNVEAIRSELESTRQSLAELSVVLMSQQKLQGSYGTLTVSIREKIERLGSIPEVDPAAVDATAREIDEIQKRLAAVTQKRDILEKQRIAYENHEKSKSVLDSTYPGSWEQYQSSVFTQQDIWSAAEQERLYRENVSHARQHGVDYDEINIRSKIAEHQAAIDESPKIDARIRALNQVEELERELGPINDITTTEEEVVRARDKYNTLKQGADIHECPYCKGSVRIQNNALVPGDMIPASQTDIDSALQYVTSLFQQWEKVKRAIQIREQLQQLVPQIGDRNETKVLSTQVRPTIVQHQQIVSALSTISVVSPPEIGSDLIQKLVNLNTSAEQLRQVTSSQFSPQHDEDLTLGEKLVQTRQKHDAMIVNLQSRKELTDQITATQSQLDKIVIDPTIDQRHTEKEAEVKAIERKLEYSSRVANLVGQISTITGQLDKIILIPDIDELHRRKSDQLNDLSSKIVMIDYATKMMSKQKDLEAKRYRVTVEHQRLIDLQKLRQTAVDVECTQLQATVDAINQAMTEVLNTVFDSPITVTLKLYKQLKTNKRIKPTVNLAIYYRGAEYDSINSLSGGEGDRVSFALILALNRVSTSPVLLLDESMSSLNSNLRENCLTSLRESVCDTKTIMCVNHEDVEGHYDEVVRF